MNIQGLLDDLVAENNAAPPEGAVADYIPGLETVDPDQFGIAVAMNSGQSYSAGHSSVPFSIQSISKVFTLALAMALDGDELWARVSREPSGTPFNSLVQLEQEHGIPRNPFINSGALVVTDRLLSLTRDSQEYLQTFLRRQSSNPLIQVDEVIAASERATGHRNASLAYFLTSYKNMVNDVPRVLDAYFRQCAVTMNCEDLATAGSFLSRGGRGVDGSVLTADQVRRLNAVMLTCGTYDAAGDFAYRVGLPCKSGVGGGILAVVPRHMHDSGVGPTAGKIRELVSRGSGLGQAHRKNRLVNLLNANDSTSLSPDAIFHDPIAEETDEYSYRPSQQQCLSGSGKPEPPPKLNRRQRARLEAIKAVSRDLSLLKAQRERSELDEQR